MRLRVPLLLLASLSACGDGGNAGTTDHDASSTGTAAASDATSSSTTSAGGPATDPTADPPGDPTTGPAASTVPDPTDETSPVGTTDDPTTTTDAATTDAATTDDATTDDTTGAPQDACADVDAACPGAPPASGGGGLVEIDRCAFPLKDAGTWDAQAARVAKLSATLPTLALADLPAADFNRIAVAVQTAPGGVDDLVHAFRWNDEDVDNPAWIPQGLTGTPDAVPGGVIGGRKLLLVSWYHDVDPGKGARVSLVDVTDPNKPRYRHILLVEPVDGDPVSFAPIHIHAGGMAWVGDLLYVVHTGKGFRVFDTRALLRVATEKESVGWSDADQVYYGGLYKYVLPQVGAYTHASACAPIFSSVALDRSSAPPTLVSSEYCNGSTACAETYSGRMFRWPLQPDGDRLAAAEVWPLAAHYMAQSHVQGGLVADGTVYLSSSAPPGSAGDLYVLPGGGASATVPWVNTPEDLMRDGDLLWSLSEGTGERVVFAVDMNALPG